MNAEFEILFHPDMKVQPKEVVFLYSLNAGGNWDDMYANRLTEKNWNIQIYDMQENQPVEFFLRILLKDGRNMFGKKEGNNYKVTIRDNTKSQKYKAQIRISEENFVSVGRKCLVCEQAIPNGSNMCPNAECAAVYCPFCNRMLPPYSNFCPWDKKSFMIN